MSTENDNQPEAAVRCTSVVGDGDALATHVAQYNKWVEELTDNELHYVNLEDAFVAGFLAGRRAQDASSPTDASSATAEVRT